MGTFDLITDIYDWIAHDIIGNEIITAILFAGLIYGLLVSMDLPPKATFAFMLPVMLGLITIGYIGWFGWLIIALAGMIFGVLVYRLYERG